MYFGISKRVIRKTGEMGRIVVLDDNSVLEVSTLDKMKSMMWMVGDGVIVRPYIGRKLKIEHIRRNEQVDATLLKTL